MLRLPQLLFGVLLIKGYLLLLLWGMAQKTPVPEDYRAFLFLDPGQNRAQRLEAINKSFLERLAPYDGQYYLDIAEHGYRVLREDDPNLGSGPQGNYAFFPLYPLIIRSLKTLGPSPRLAMLLALNLALACAGAVGLAILAQRLGISAWVPVLLLLTFPTAVYQCALYTESLFLCLSVGSALCAAGSGRWAPVMGTALGCLAGLTRPQGILVALLWIEPAWKAWRGGASPGTRLCAFMPIAAPFVGVAIFATILWGSVGSPIAFLTVQKHWARELSPVHLLGEVFRPWAYEGPPFDQAAVWIGLLLLPAMWRRLPVGLALFGTASVLLPLGTGTVLSLGRFISVSIAHFLGLAALLQPSTMSQTSTMTVARPWGVRWAVIAVFVCLQSVLVRGFVGWLFVG